MAGFITRRDFLKCTGAAVLTVAAAGILAGCGDAGNSELPALTAGKTANADGVMITLMGYQQHPISEMVGNYAGQTVIRICFKLENASGKTIQMGNTTQDYLSRVSNAILNNDFSGLATGEFTVSKDGKSLGNAAIAYKTASGMLISDGVIGTLNADETGCVKVYTVIPKEWDQISIRYKPSFAAAGAYYDFTLTMADKMK